MQINFNGNSGNYGIRVNNPNNTQSNIFNFTVQQVQSQPHIDSISPATPTRSDSNQNVQVFGSQFQSGLTVTVFIPGGGQSTLSGSQIQNVTPTSFRMVVTLNGVGQYGIRVNNPDGGQSNVFQFQVVSCTPQISSISPASPVASCSNQNVQVFGSCFQSGLTVTVTFPNGGSTTLSGSQIQNVTSTFFTMVVTLNGAGTWCIRVNNPGGQQSSQFCFTVQPVSPQITSISPSSPPATVGNQNVDVFGSNFQSGLTVTVFFPGGGSGTLSGSQILNVTCTSFRMVINFNGNPGNYGIRVNNPDGRQSNTFTFNVHAVASAPPGYALILSDEGIQVYRKDYAAGQPDFVTVVNLNSGTIRNLTGIVTNDPNGFVERKSMSQFWNDAINQQTAQQRAKVVVNGTFFSTNDFPAPIAFGLKANGNIISYGYGLNEFPGLIRTFSFDPSTSIAVIQAYSTGTFNGPTQEVIGALDPAANKSAGSYIGRTFVGIRDDDGDGFAETVLLFSSSYARQVDASNVLTTFGASLKAMLDGGGSTGLIIDGIPYIAATRTVPHALAVYAGR
jgi:hypothetical protein